MGYGIRLKENSSVTTNQLIGVAYGQVLPSERATHTMYELSYTDCFVVDQSQVSSLLPHFVNNACVESNIETGLICVGEGEQVTVYIGIFAKKDMSDKEVLWLDYGWKDLPESQLERCFCPECQGKGYIGTPMFKTPGSTKGM